MKKALLVSLLSLYTGSVFAHDVYVHANGSSGTHGQIAYASSEHKVRLYNGRDYSVSYTYHYQLCVDGVPACQQVDVPVTLGPHSGTPEGKWTDQRVLQISHVWSAGNYQIRAKTWIDGDGAKSVDDHNVITIY